MLTVRAPRAAQLRQVSAICLICILLGGIAASLNARFYSTFGSFYDSLSYFNHMARVMSQADAQGVAPAIRDATVGSTVFLPWVFSALLGTFVEPSRYVAIVVQLPLVGLLLAMSIRYFRVVCGVTERTSLVYAVPLVSYPAVFFYNGGLCDFRMDLTQACGYGAFIAALAVARSVGTIRSWVLVGVVAGIAALSRATAPVYMVIVAGIAFLWDLRQRGLRNVVPGYASAAVMLAVIAGWFYILNLQYLHYYYAVWNTDANSRLPLHESSRHVVFLYNHIGPFLFAALLLAAVATVFAVRSDWKGVQFNWVALTGAVVPIAYLVFSGAGLNPFVSMAAVPPLVMFLLCPAKVDGAGSTGSSRLSTAAVVVGLVCSVVVSVRRFETQVDDWLPYRAGIAELVRSVEEDAHARGASTATLAFLYQGAVDDQVVENFLLFDLKRHWDGDAIVGNGITVRFVHFGFGSETEWREMANGLSDEATVSSVLSQAKRQADYVVMTNVESSLSSGYPVNRHHLAIRRALERDREYVRMNSLIRLSRLESVAVYRPIPGRADRNGGAFPTQSE